MFAIIESHLSSSISLKLPFCLSDPNTYYIKTKVGPQNGPAKCSSLPNGAVDSDGGVGAESKNGSVLRGDLFMYHDAKAKRQRLLREHEKKRDRLAQVRQ